MSWSSACCVPTCTSASTWSRCTPRTGAPRAGLHSISSASPCCLLYQLTAPAQQVAAAGRLCPASASGQCVPRWMYAAHLSARLPSPSRPQVTVILQHLAADRVLQDEHLDLLWSVTEQDGAHENVKTHVYDCLAELVPELAPEQVGRPARLAAGHVSSCDCGNSACAYRRRWPQLGSPADPSPLAPCAPVLARWTSFLPRCLQSASAPSSTPSSCWSCSSRLRAPTNRCAAILRGTRSAHECGPSQWP